MFNNRTLIVVGAGASSECRLPTGLELKAQIAALLEDQVRLASARPDRIVLRNDLKCGTFFREYWRSLSPG